MIFTIVRKQTKIFGDAWKL